MLSVPDGPRPQARLRTHGWVMSWDAFGDHELERPRVTLFTNLREQRSSTEVHAECVQKVCERSFVFLPRVQEVQEELALETMTQRRTPA